MTIISAEHERIAAKVTELMDRGVTVLRGYGYYTGEDKNVLYIAISKQEVSMLKKSCGPKIKMLLLLFMMYAMCLGRASLIFPNKRPRAKSHCRFTQSAAGKSHMLWCTLNHEGGIGNGLLW